MLYLPLRPIPADELASSRKMVEDYPEPKWVDDEKTCLDREWVEALVRLDLYDKYREDPHDRYEIQAFRIGDFALVTLMGEPYVEVQLRIKLESPAPYTFVAHFCNGYAGYVPTRSTFERPANVDNIHNHGGQESRTLPWSKFTPDALDRIGDEAVRLLKKLFP